MFFTFCSATDGTSSWITGTSIGCSTTAWVSAVGCTTTTSFDSCGASTATFSIASTCCSITSTGGSRGSAVGSSIVGTSGTTTCRIGKVVTGVTSVIDGDSWIDGTSNADSSATVLDDVFSTFRVSNGAVVVVPLALLLRVLLWLYKPNSVQFAQWKLLIQRDLEVPVLVLLWQVCFPVTELEWPSPLVDQSSSRQYELVLQERPAKYVAQPEPLKKWMQ